MKTKRLTKEHFICSGLSAKGKKESLVYALLTAAAFIVGAFTFWEFLYQFCNMIGSIVSGTPTQALAQLVRMLPLVLTAVTYLFYGVALTSAFRARNQAVRGKIIARAGVTSAVLGALVLLYTLVGRFAGIYSSLVEGNPSPLYPLDHAFGGLLFIAIGLLAWRYAKALPKKGSALPESSFVRKGGTRALMVLSYMVALCSFAACFYAFYVVDWTHGGLFFNVMLVLNYFSAFLMAAVYRFVYAEMKEEYRPQAKICLGFSFLVLNAILFGLYMLSVQLQNEAPNLNAFGILPIEFTASFNAFLPIFVLNNLVGPLVAGLKGIAAKKKAKKSK